MVRAEKRRRVAEQRENFPNEMISLSPVGSVRVCSCTRAKVMNDHRSFAQSMARDKANERRATRCA